MPQMRLRRRLVEGKDRLRGRRRSFARPKKLSHVRPGFAGRAGMGREDVTSTLGRRVEALEAATDAAGGGCERCVGVLTSVHGTPSGEFGSAAWNGQAITEEELAEREAETECPRCGRGIDPDAATVIRVGGGPTPGT